MTPSDFLFVTFKKPCSLEATLVVWNKVVRWEEPPLRWISFAYHSSRERRGCSWSYFGRQRALRWLRTFWSLWVLGPWYVYWSLQQGGSEIKNCWTLRNQGIAQGTWWCYEWWWWPTRRGECRRGQLGKRRSGWREGAIFAGKIKLLFCWLDCPAKITKALSLLFLCLTYVMRTSLYRRVVV